MTRNELLSVAKPIPLKTWEVRAILDSRKTQTRQVMKTPGGNPIGAYIPELGFSFGGKVVGDINDNVNDPFGFCTGVGIMRPRYLPGDYLYVRETWGFDTGDDDEYGTGSFVYMADNGEEPPNGKWHPSIHMPKEAARIFLRVTDVRVERLQDISEDDAKAEGIQSVTKDGSLFKYCVSVDDWAENYKQTHKGNWWAKMPRSATEAYRLLWDNLNAKRGYGWDTNPWVWMYEFERVVSDEK